ncbi:competence type IV pilus minor pilin ComGF [Sutcliffiella rhizosphaerae]|uniref:Prepilin-type N-terminal cleavage/methylation domain-containing protein n=1 Tax=Sutcliffiella rhizosphaerae TaxID=2880967 RepID=A0ABM8YH98_9BACI|nr:competence type IV pilus minor pilin ComGF [Sutcliffiella rhizosphaerae]CAG9619267.1 hypothetical protein BACCIP111883_00034 [Sutcliffiella rhizosphaerae]
MFIIRKEQGFTLLEVMISFSLVLLLTALFPILMKSIYHLTEKKDGIHPLELEVFIQQTAREVRNASEISVNGSVVKLTNQIGQLVSFEHYEDKLRRRVDGKGHELMLHGVMSAAFEEVSGGVMIKLKGRDENQYEILIRRIPVP